MREGNVPSGQRYIKDFIVYAALDIPEVKIEEYRLEVYGLVENPFSLTYDELKSSIDTEYVRDFHCVTKWSVRDVRWQGVKFSTLAQKARMSDDAKWVMFHSLDDYTTPVPVEDAMSEDAIIAVFMNGKPIPPDNGFPARPFFPGLYGWKSAKWLSGIEFIDRYEDGFWENNGYHQRGNVWEEERFKSFGWKNLKRKVFRKS